MPLFSNASALNRQDHHLEEEEEEDEADKLKLNELNQTRTATYGKPVVVLRCKLEGESRKSQIRRTSVSNTG